MRDGNPAGGLTCAILKAAAGGMAAKPLFLIPNAF